MTRRAYVLLLVPSLLALTPRESVTQSILTGVVRDSATRAPVDGAEILVQGLRTSTRTDTRGRFFLEDIGAGRFLVVARKIGYDSASAILPFSGADSAAHDFDMVMRAQPLRPVAVRGKTEPFGAKLRGFERRREFGIGHFLTADDLVKELNRRTSEILQKIPGVGIVHGMGLDAYVTNSRGIQSVLGTAKICPPGRPCAAPCPAAIILDGVTVYGGNGEPPFDVNSIQPSEIAAMEYYAGPAQMPAEFNATRKTCGALVIWTK